MNKLGKIILSLVVIIIAILSLFIPFPKKVLKEPYVFSKEATLFFEETNIVEEEHFSEEKTVVENDDEFESVFIEDDKILDETILEDNFYSERDYKTVPKLKEIVMPQSVLIPFRTPAKIEKLEFITPLEKYIEVDEATQPPIFDYKVLRERIQYPLTAKRQNREGRVVVRLFIDSTGKVVQAIIVEESSSDFGEAALKTFTNLVVKPAFLKGVPVAVTLLFPINFSLH